MRPLNKPTLDPRLVYDGCVETIQDEDLKARLTAERETVLGSVPGYEAAGADGDLTRIQTSEQVGLVTKQEMMALYTNQLVQNSGPRSKYYDVLKLATLICPFCGHLRVKTLDHYLPKAHFPLFSVTPVNLVPSCRDCNSAKTASRVTKLENQVLHPYFDRLPDEQWLFAELGETHPPSFQFHAKPPAGWTEIIRRRVATHFRVFELAELYTTQAGEEFGNIEHVILELYKTGGAAKVRSHLDGELRSREANHRNSWQTAFYQACAASDWFCECCFQE